jgi:hypothetical protein
MSLYYVMLFNGELEYAINYNIVGSKVVHHTIKRMRFEYYPPNAQYPNAQIRWSYFSEHED